MKRLFKFACAAMICLITASWSIATYAVAAVETDLLAAATADPGGGGASPGRTEMARAPLAAALPFTIKGKPLDAIPKTGPFGPVWFTAGGARASQEDSQIQAFTACHAGTPGKVVSETSSLNGATAAVLAEDDKAAGPNASLFGNISKSSQTGWVRFTGSAQHRSRMLKGPGLDLWEAKTAFAASHPGVGFYGEKIPPSAEVSHMASQS